MIYSFVMWSILYSFGGGQFYCEISPNIEEYEIGQDGNNISLIIGLQASDGVHVGYSDSFVLDNINANNLESIQLKNFSIITNAGEVEIDCDVYFNNNYYDYVYFLCENSLYDWQSVYFPDQNYSVSPTIEIFNKNIANQNYINGYEQGYREGENSGNGVNNVISWFGNVWNALTNFLSLEIAPNLKIGTLITIPIVVGVLFFVLKALIQ